MSYVKKEWKIKDFQKGDKVFVDGLNHMEEGIEQGGGGSEPAQYLKDAVKDGSTLIITKKDGSTVEFTGGEPEAFLKDAAVNGEKLTITKKDGSVVEFDISAKAAQTALTAEATARQTADEALQNAITDEVNTRETAINTVNESVNQEAITREQADITLQNNINAKQDTISDLDTIRDGAAKGATAIQEHQDISGKVDKELTNANGKAQILNEADGGGIFFVKNDETRKSFVGVNDSTAGGPDAQIYAIDPSNSNYGAKLDILKDGIYYTVGNTPYTERITNNNKLAVKGDLENKNWYNLSISEEQAEAILGNGQQIVIKDFFTDGAYDPGTDNAKFAKDYFRVDLNNSANLVGTMCKTMQDLTKIYVDFTTPSGGKADWSKSEISKSIQELMYEYGVDYHYYKTIVLFAGTNDTEKSWIEAAGALDAQNVVYLQDITQQPWEYNYTTEEKTKVTARGQLETEEYGSTYVLSIKGGDASSNIGLMFNYYGKAAAYWDTTANDTKWKALETGKIYKCAFDTEHDTLRWLLTLDENGDPIEFTEEELVALQQNGIAFGNGLYAALGLTDTSEKQIAQCCGNDNEYLVKLISINEPFKSQSLLNLNIIARPAGLIPDYIEFYVEPETEEEEGTWVVEENGVYTWYFEADGVGVNLFVPSTEENRKYLVIQEADSNSGSASSSIAYNYNTLYRHTFNILTTENALEVGDYKVTSTFQATSAQAGDSAIEYILFSDESYQYGSPDWMLPAQGKLLKVTSIEGTKIEPTTKLTRADIKISHQSAADLATIISGVTFTNSRYYIFSETADALAKNSIWIEDYSHSTICSQDNTVYYFRTIDAEGSTGPSVYCVIQEFTHSVKGVQVAQGWYSSLEGSIIECTNDAIPYMTLLTIENGANGVSEITSPFAATVGASNETLKDIISSGSFIKKQLAGNIYRIKATYTDPDNMYRCLTFDCVNDEGDLFSITPITAINYKKYYATDFRSEIAGFLS